MQAYITLTRRELGSFFVSFQGYIILAAVMFLMGLSFVTLLYDLQEQPSVAPVTQLYFATPFFWCIVLLGSPLITMRLIALEKYSGTFETLMTTPVSDKQVVLSKFSAAMFFYILTWVPLLPCMLVLRHYTNDPEPVDWHLIGSTYLGITLLGGLFMSMGCLASASTKSQIVAALLGFTPGFALWLLSFLAGHLASAPVWAAQTVAYLSIIDHVNDFARGVVDTRHIVFYVTATALFLFLTLRVVESRRWK